MKKNPKDNRVNSSLFSFRRYIIFFLLISVIVTCCFLLFLNSMDIDFADVKKSALITFVNVMFLSLICSLIDGIRRKITVERPVKRILKATHQLTQGDFSARIQALHGFDSMNEFDAIIEDFNKMAVELSGIETLRTDFITSVSHELKTPLAVIQNYATILQNPSLTEQQRIEYAKTITEASRKLSELIMNILRLNKLENQQIFPECAAYDLSEQLRKCLISFEEQWEKKGLDMDTDIDEVTVKADEELLSLVWNNLLSNAIKFTPPDGKITVSLKKETDFVVVKISDTGCGISPEAGEHIFEKFYQADPSHGTQGNGLGLALVKRVIDIESGEITVESTIERGSTFIVKLPRSRG